MVIVIIHWKIKPTAKDKEEFLDVWRKETVVKDRSGMVGEFLSTVESKSDFPYITWDLDDNLELYTSFVNVGIWQDELAFHEQIAQYFNDSREPRTFEQTRRVRSVLRPECWRVGHSVLPQRDSDGVL